MASTAVVLLAGGQARRFPGKLERAIEGRAMVARIYERVRAGGWPVYIAGKGSFSRELDAELDAPLIIDRSPGSGPLGALLSACTQIGADRVFAVAADQPRLEARVLAQLAESWQPGDEAIVPEHDGDIEPLAALYSRRAILREAFGLRASGKKALRDLIDRLAVRRVAIDGACFHNVNRAADLEKV